MLYNNIVLRYNNKNERGKNNEKQIDSKRKD